MLWTKREQFINQPTGYVAGTSLSGLIYIGDRVCLFKCKNLGSLCSDMPEQVGVSTAGEGCHAEAGGRRSSLLSDPSR